MPDWKNLPAMFSRATLHPAAVAAADGSSADLPWCVAFSGGADSLALLLLVWTHWPERRRRLAALHFNHRLRGAASDGDEQFCREVCAALEVEFVSAAWNLPPGRPGEAEAREARQAFFEREMRSRAAVVLWTGHQKDDIAETQLMRLARGSGPAGLAAPRPVSRQADGRMYLRPLLTLGKGAIMASLTDRGIAWREDATNATRDYFRTRIRHDVLPRWQDAACHSVLGGAALSRELCEEDDDALEFWLRQLGVAAAAERLDLRPLRGLPRALWRRALRRWDRTGALSRSGFEELLALAEGGQGRVSAADGFLDVADAVICWQAGPREASSWGPLPLNEGSAVRLPDGAELSAQTATLDAERRAAVLAGQVDPATQAFVAADSLPFHARSWRPRDRFRPLGAPGSGKLQDLFVNRKIPLERRMALPVVCGVDGEIVWVPGFPPSEAVKLSSSTAVAVQLTYRGGTSTLTDQSSKP